MNTDQIVNSTPVDDFENFIDDEEDANYFNSNSNAGKLSPMKNRRVRDTEFNKSAKKFNKPVRKTVQSEY